MKEPVPPPALTVAVPVHWLKQEILVPVTVAVIAAGCVRVTVLVLVHPFLSESVRVYVAAAKPVQAEVLHPPNAQL